MQKRFSGQIGKEYKLFQLSVPHHERLQDTVQDTLRKYFSGELGSFTVVEIGSGGGYTLGKILDSHSKVKVIAIDSDAEMLDQAKHVFEDQKERVSFQLGDAIDTLKDMADNSVDAIASAYTIHNFTPEYRDELFSEISRVLKNGAIFVNADKYAYDDTGKQKRALEAQIVAFKAYDEQGKASLREEWTKHYMEDEKIKFTESEQNELFERYGFSAVKMIFREGMEATFVAYK